MILSILLVLILVTIVIWAKPLFDAQKGIQVQWEAAPRHLLAALLGLCAFVVLFAVLLLLDLFEREIFSWKSLLHILQISLILIVGGCAIVAAAVVFTRR